MVWMILGSTAVVVMLGAYLTRPRYHGDLNLRGFNFDTAKKKERVELQDRY
jgi:hypothetical protein